MNMKPILILLAMWTIMPLKAQDMTAQEIVDACILKHGGSHYEDAHFAYDFRKHHFEFHYTKGMFRYERHTKDGVTRDILTNDGFRRTIQGKEAELTEKKKRGYSNSVNSVNYFAFLPYFLNDEAVNKELVGEAQIQGKTYYKVQVTFDQDGGGDDFEDIYMYWIGKDDFSMDFLAYSFHVNGGGVRFRSAYNKRVVGGITFQDYVNYKHDKNTPVSQLDALFTAGQLNELSKIELENIQVIDKK